jgi:hypothetical protein
MPRFASFSSHPRPSHRSRALPPRADVPVALPSTGAPSSVGIWPAPPLSSLSSVCRPPSLSSPNPRPSLTSLSLSLQPAGCVADRRGPPEATIVVGAPPSRSSSSASTSPTRFSELPPSLGHPAHFSCNTEALGLGPASPRAPAHRRWPHHHARPEHGDHAPRCPARASCVTGPARAARS